MIVLVQSPFFLQNPKQLSIGVTLDLVLTIPLIYLFLIRQKDIPNTTVVPIFIIGMLIASYILPANQQTLLTQIKYWVFPVVETTVLLTVGYKMWQARQRFKNQKTANLDFFTALKNATNEIMPARVSTLFSTEVAVIYYGFFNWKKRILRPNEFSYHQKSGVMAVLFALIFIILIEATVFHLLLERWSVMAAWILTALSIYSGLQIFGMTRSLSKRPIVIEDTRLYLRYGIFSEVTIDLEDIEKVELLNKRIALDDTTIAMSPIEDLDKPNILIRLKKEGTLSRLYGFNKTFQTIVFHVDDKENFKETLDQKILVGA